MMDGKVVDADANDNTEDHQEGLDNFNFNNVSDIKSNYTFVQEVVKCSLKMKYFWICEESIVSTIRNIMREKTPLIFSLTISLPFI